MNQEQYVSQILNSINGISNAFPNDDLFSKIETKMLKQKTVSIQTIWIAAASLILLVGINATLIKVKLNQNQNKIAVILTEINKDNQLY